MSKRGFKVQAMILGVITVWSICIGTAFAYDKSYTTYMAGNSHIDTAWQWTTATTRSQYIPNTFNQAVNLMNSNPDYTFNASAAQHFKWMKSDNPTLYNSVKSKVANGQLNIVGGQWVEPDLNLTSGESLVRQSLYGQRFFQQEFGKKSTVGWVPDVFGFSGQLPQILKKSGMDYFVTTKLNWNDTNPFPYELFKWQGIDGTQVIADKPRNDYTAGVDRNNINYTLDEPNRHGIKKGLVLYGSGDRGGGPTQAQIDSIHSLDSDSTMPNVKMYTANQFFNDFTATDKANITDIWNGEMYLEYHRGTYTSQALIKKNNRLGEIAAEEAEKYSSMANWLGAVSYPQSTINSAWETLMLNQFHDILPGSGTSDQVAEAQRNGASVLNSFNGVLNSAIGAIASKADTTVSSGVPIVVFNPLSFIRKQPVETSVTFSTVPSSVRVYDNGIEIPSQVLSISGNTANIVFILDTVPSMGFKVVNAVANTGSYSGSTGLSIGNNTITSDLFQVTINSSNGNISSILDKTNSRQVMTGEGNILQILEDTPTDYDAWNVDYDDMTRAPLSTCTLKGISIAEQGPVKCTYKVDKSYGSSTFSQYITLYPGINRVDVRMTADWHESHKMLKVAFPWNVSGATSATYEIAYGSLSRSNQRDTSFNKARFEVSAQKWADLSNSGYGVSLLNNCKYGYDTYLNTMRLSLLRSPNTPDNIPADQGSHEFTYSIYPHSGDWKSANSVYKGYELNYPLIANQTDSHTGTLGKSSSFMSINVPNVIISAVKKAEDSNDYIIRMYESQGTSINATITLPGNITSISETNLLEENTGTQSYSGNTFSTTLGSYEIKTFKASFGGSTPPPPSGDTNVALNKTATANQYVTGEEPYKAVDGSVAPYTSGNSKWCSNVSGDKWLKVDLGQNYDISRWVVKHAGAGGENTAWNTKDFKLQKSIDGNTWTDVDSVTGNTQNITDRIVSKFNARYVRLYITAPTSTTDIAARIYEFEVYGTAAQPPAIPSVPTGLTATAAGSSQINISWNASSGATGYDLLVDNTTVPDVSSPYAHTGLAANSTHTYAVRAKNSAGISAWSTTVSATTMQQAGDTNVALNKAASANQYVTGEDPYKAVDGSVAPYTSGNSKWCSNVSGDKWLKVDLGQNYDISRWVVKHAGAGGENTAWNTKDFKLQKSADGSTWTDVDSVTGNTQNITDRNVTKFNTRYVRLYITAPTSTSDIAARIYEFEVYGTAAQPPASNATFYQDINYGGKAVSLAPGNYTLTQLQSAGISDNWTSSVKIPGGLTVEIYDSDNFAGTMWKFTADNANFVTAGCNDRMTSVKVY